MNFYSNMIQDNHVLVFVHHYKSIFFHQLWMVLNKLLYVVVDPFYMEHLYNQSMMTNQKIHYLKRKNFFTHSVFFFFTWILPAGKITPEGDDESLGHATWHSLSCNWSPSQLGRLVIVGGLRHVRIRLWRPILHGIPLHSENDCHSDHPRSS